MSQLDKTNYCAVDKRHFLRGFKSLFHGVLIKDTVCNSRFQKSMGSLCVVIPGTNLDKNPTPFYATDDQLRPQRSLVGADAGDIFISFGGFHL